jgi:hypothetical protein
MSEATNRLKYNTPIFKSYDGATQLEMDDFLPVELMRYRTSIRYSLKLIKYRKKHPEIKTMNECVRQLIAANRSRGKL